MKKLGYLLFFVLLVLFAGMQAGAETVSNSGCAISNASTLTSMTWISDAPANSTNAGLLLGAKHLMKGIYTYSSSSPDYLPTSYTSQNSQLTQYTIHSTNESSVYWAPDQRKQLQWVSEPGTDPKGWSGVVHVAGTGLTKSSSPHCFTDCSGFVTSLFTYANTITPTKFTNWTVGGFIPEAGCNDPDGSCVTPNPLNYYNLFTSGKYGWFENVTLEELQPGDLIAYANTKNDSDSGHIMLVVAVAAACKGDQWSRVVVIADETANKHSFDTRPITAISPTEKTGGGLGMGVIKLSYVNDNTLQFYWGLQTTHPEVGSIALGRAL